MSEIDTYVCVEENRKYTVGTVYTCIRHGNGVVTVYGPDLASESFSEIWFDGIDRCYMKNTAGISDLDKFMFHYKMTGREM